MATLLRTVLRAISVPFRFGAIRLLLAIVLLVGGIGGFALFIAASWTDGGASFTIAFLLVFASAIVGVIALWLTAIGSRSRSSKTLDGLLALSPADFEMAVARLLRRQGYRDVSVVGGPGDLAVDILCRERGGASVAVQCKRKARGHRVGSAELQQFIGMITVHHGADVGMYVTTSSYTKPAIELAEVHEIVLVDGEMLSELVRGKRRLVRKSATRAA